MGSLAAANEGFTGSRLLALHASSVSEIVGNSALINVP
jgi:hypothetical protein